MEGPIKRNLKQILIALLQLSRWHNVLIGMISIFVGAWITGTIHPLVKVLLASLSGGIIAAAANAINDYYDIEIDRINKPYRPLPAGKLSPAVARNFAIILFTLGVGISLLISAPAFAIASVAVILLYLYSSHLKRTVLWGNTVVSFISGMAFVYGGVAVNRLKIALIPAGFSFFYHFGREVLKDIEDLEGDRSQNARTFPIRFGLNPARVLVTTLFSLLILLTTIPYGLGIFGVAYLILVLVSVDLFLVYVVVSLWRDASPPNLHRLSEWLRLDMLAGLLAIIVGVYWR